MMTILWQKMNQGHIIHVSDLPEKMDRKHTRNVNGKDNGFPSIKLFESYETRLDHIPDRLDNFECYLIMPHPGIENWILLDDETRLYHISARQDHFECTHLNPYPGIKNGILLDDETRLYHIPERQDHFECTHFNPYPGIENGILLDDETGVYHISALLDNFARFLIMPHPGIENGILLDDEIRLDHIPDRQDNSKCSWTGYKGESENVKTRNFHDDETRLDQIPDGQDFSKCSWTAFIRLCSLLSQLTNEFLENIMNVKIEQVTILWINRCIKYTLLWLTSLITGTLWQLLDVVFGTNETNVQQGMRNIYLLFLHEYRKEAKRVWLFEMKSTNMGRIVKSEKNFVPRTIISEKCFVYKTSVLETLFPKMTNCDNTCRLKSFKIILMSRLEICVLQRFTQDWKPTVCRGWKSQFKSNKSLSNDGEIEMNLQDTSGPVSMKTNGEIKKQKYLQLTNTTKCQLCTNRNRAVNWCNTCQMNICSFCKLYHQKVWDVMDHDIHPLRETY